MVILEPMWHFQKNCATNVALVYTESSSILSDKQNAKYYSTIDNILV